MLNPIGKGRRTAAPVPEQQALMEIVIFEIEGEQFGLDIYKVVEITKTMAITKVPRSLPFIEGVVNLRGRVIPVLDLRKRLGYPAVDQGESGRIVIVRIDGRRLGLQVDAVNRVAGIPRDTIEEVPPATLQIDSEFIEGVGHLDSSLVILIRLEKLLTPKERALLAERQQKAPEKVKS